MFFHHRALIGEVKVDRADAFQYIEDPKPAAEPRRR
jgi:hypothetical protein